MNLLLLSLMFAGRKDDQIEDLQRQVTERALNIRHAHAEVLCKTKELTRPANALTCVHWHIQPAIRA